MILKKIKNYLTSKINTSFIHIQNDSSFHNHLRKGLTHLKIILISNDFINQKHIDRHRTVYFLLSECIKEKIYSITLDTYTPMEWKHKKNKKNHMSHCLQKQ